VEFDLLLNIKEDAHHHIMKWKLRHGGEEEKCTKG